MNGNWLMYVPHKHYIFICLFPTIKLSKLFNVLIKKTLNTRSYINSKKNAVNINPGPLQKNKTQKDPPSSKYVGLSNSNNTVNLK